MLPTLKEGDMVFFKKYIKNKSLLKVGQIVIIYHPLKNIRLIKRVKSIIKNSIEVLGDNIEYSDDSNYKRQNTNDCRRVNQKLSLN